MRYSSKASAKTRTVFNGLQKNSLLQNTRYGSQYNTYLTTPQSTQTPTAKVQSPTAGVVSLL